MPKLSVNGVEVSVEQGATILQACEAAGFEIPRFCYHEKLKIAGNCRMCLVQVEKMPKLVASCAMPATDGMVIHTNTNMVKEGRESVMEFLLINHPLDCPICDQGGECDLQDQAMKYGKGSSRFREEKHAFKDQYMGPLVKTSMTRCIHCTRCVRFIADIAGIPELGTIGRGGHTEISTYIQKSLTSEISGNIIDICPVGALTSKPYAFKARNWELRKMESIDVMDAIGSNIRVDYKGKEVMRILPVNNDDINEEWLTDKARFSYDGLLNQRLDKFYVRKNHRLQESTAEEALSIVKEKLLELQPDEVAFIAGDLLDLETMFIAKEIAKSLSCYNLECRQAGEKFISSNEFSYKFNSSISAIDQADAILLIGCNIRKDAPLVCSRIRQAVMKGCKVAIIGEMENNVTGFAYEHLGSDISLLEKLTSKKLEFAKTLTNAKNPMVIVGMDAITREDGQAILNKAMTLAEKVGAIRDDYIGFNVLNTAASRVGAMTIGFLPNKEQLSLNDVLTRVELGKIKMLFLLGADEIDTSKLKDCSVVYLGHHGDKGANIASVILPGCAYTEKDGIYVNIEGKMQFARKAVDAPGKAMDDREILFMLATELGVKLNYSNLNELRKELFLKHPDLNQPLSRKWKILETEVELEKNLPLVIEDYDYYMTNPISRASKAMVSCSKEFYKNKEEVF